MSIINDNQKIRTSFISQEDIFVSIILASHFPFQRGEDEVSDSIFRPDKQHFLLSHIPHSFWIHEDIALSLDRSEGRKKDSLRRREEMSCYWEKDLIFSSNEKDLREDRSRIDSIVIQFRYLAVKISLSSLARTPNFYLRFQRIKEKTFPPGTLRHWPLGTNERKKKIPPS